MAQPQSPQLLARAFMRSASPDMEMLDVEEDNCLNEDRHEAMLDSMQIDDSGIMPAYESSIQGKILQEIQSQSQALLSNDED